jgi:hypothetical protein
MRKEWQLSFVSLVMMLLGRRNEIVTAGITISVVMIVAALSPASAWLQPLLRLLDTLVWFWRLCLRGPIPGCFKKKA